MSSETKIVPASSNISSSKKPKVVKAVHPSAVKEMIIAAFKILNNDCKKKGTSLQTIIK